MYFDIFEQSPFSIELYDYSGRLINANSAYLKLFGLKNLIGTEKSNLFDKPNIPPNVIIEFKEGIRDKYEFEYVSDFENNRNSNLSGIPNNCNLNCKISTIVKGAKISGYIVYTTAKNEKDNVGFQVEKLEQNSIFQNTSQDKLLSTFAHDLKNPLNAIIGFTELMLKNFDQLDDETLQRGLKTIDSASSQANQLLDNLLIWSKNQSGQSPFNPEKLNLRTQFDELLKNFESSLSAKGIKVIIGIKRSIEIIGDKYMIGFVLQNLISNAIKFSYKGSKIRISTENKDQELRISVLDYGVGISPERQSNLFEIEKRSCTVGTENESGTGMSLILCKDFVNLHHGKIWVESIPGVGSKFTISLPPQYVVQSRKTQKQVNR